MLSSVQLTLMMGPIIAVPVPSSVLESLASVEVSIHDVEPSGFKLSFSIDKQSPLQILFLLTGGMPLLFMRTFANSLLDEACHEAVHKQIEYGEQKKVPWGVSESAYSALDANQVYQYRAFGIPSLALKQALTDDLVVAPYATMLALPLAPAAATANLERLKSMGMEMCIRDRSWRGRRAFTPMQS